MTQRHLSPLRESRPWRFRSSPIDLTGYDSAQHRRFLRSEAETDSQELAPSTR
ncbi:hypothetical protein [Synechococcus sp. MIT S1220]|uniref:hypothetical protein n=1 Tax=Synechococcus sp. MIT S1220 TaxID=3082549 RepID=UPI0039B080B9